LTWLGLSGEDAPELMRCAPVSVDAVRGGKIQAVAQLTLLITGPLLLWLFWLSPGAALRTLALGCFAGLAAVALNLWHARPTRRGAFAARHRESKLLALIEMAMSILLGIVAALVVVGSLWTMAPLAIIAVILGANRPRVSAAASE
jgi:ABC-2 type transport system permease protein